MGSVGVLAEDLSNLIPNQYEQIEFYSRKCFTEKALSVVGHLEQNYFNYYKVKQNEKWGLIDRKNNIVLNFKYDKIDAIGHIKIEPNYNFERPNSYYGSYSPSFFLVESNGMNWLINDKEQIIIKGISLKIPILYTNLSSTQKDELIILTLDNTYGAISKKGEIVIPFEYTNIRPYIGNYFRIQKTTKTKENSYRYFGIANAKGEIIQPPVFSFMTGQAVQKGTKSGILNKDFNDFLVPLKYDFIQPIRSQSTQVEHSHYLLDLNKKQGILEKDKGLIISISYDHLEAISQLDFIAKKNGKHGLIDSNENIILPFQYQLIKPTIKRQFFLLVKENNKYGLFDHRSKKWLFTPQYDSIYHKIYNTIHVQKNGKWGKVDSENKVLIPIEYDEINHKNRVRKGAKWGMYNNKHKLVLQAIYDEIISENIVRIGKEWQLVRKGKSTAISGEYDSMYKSGKLIYSSRSQKKGIIFIADSLISIPPIYDKIYFRHTTEFAKAKKDGKWGLIDKNSRIHIPFVYEEIGWLGSNRLKIFDGKNWALYDLNHNQLLPFIFKDISLIDNFNQNKIKAFGSLFQVKCSNKKGLISETGEWILPCAYQEITTNFYETSLYQDAILFPVRQKGKWGFVKQGGEVVIPFQYTTAHPFRDDMAIVYQDDKAFFINKKGERINQDTYAQIIPPNYHSKLYTVKNTNGHFGTTNSKGTIVIPVIYQERPKRMCSQLYTVKQNDKYGVINSKGQLLTECIFENAPTRYSYGLFYSNQVLLNFPNDMESKEQPSPFDFQVGRQFYKDYYKIKKQGKQGVINIKTKEIIIPCEYASLSRGRGENPMSFIHAKNPAGKFGVIDSTNKIIIPLIYNQVSVNEKENRIAIKKENKVSLLTLRGELVKELDFESINIHSNSLYPVFKDGMWGFVDANGKLVIPLQFTKASSFYPIYFNGNNYLTCSSLINESSMTVDTFITASVSIDEDLYRIDRNGNKFEQQAKPGRNRFYINKDLTGIRQMPSKKYGIIDQEGNIVVPFEYEDIDYYGGHYVYLYDGDKDGYFFLANRKIMMYEEVEDESESYDTQWVYDGKYFGFVDKQGDLLTPIHFDNAGRVTDSLVMVAKDGKVNFLNHKFETIPSDPFDVIPCGNSVSNFKLGNAIAYKNNKYGIINTKLETIVPFEYEAMLHYDHYQAMGYKAGEWEVIQVPQ